MTRLASLCAAALDIASAVAVRLEDLVGEWLDSREPLPLRSGERDLAVAKALEALERYVESRVAGVNPQPYRATLHAAVAKLVGVGGGW